MTLYLVEVSISDRQLDQVRTALDQVALAAKAVNSELIEVQVSKDLRRLFVIIEAANEAALETSFDGSELTINLLKQVRLIGQDLATIKAHQSKANYLVEWDLPAGLTMETYLARKAEKTPLYALVPEISFERTYVCEDVSKCLCFYDSPDVATVKQAREVVGAPIDRLTTIEALESFS